VQKDHVADDATSLLARAVTERKWDAEGVAPEQVFTFAHLLEAPLRCFVLASKVRRGQLVRNGAPIQLTMGNIYRLDTMWEDTIDKDLALLQFGATCMLPAHFITNFFSRFGVLGWFEPNVHEARYSLGGAGDKAIAIVEDALHLIYTVVARRGPGVGETTDEAQLRSELVHILCDGKKSFSQIQKRLPRSMGADANIPLVETLLGQLAVANDVDGTFSIKKKILAKEFDPSFFHYSDAQATKAMENVRLMRGKQAAFVPPPPPPLPTAGFAALGKIISDAEMMRIIGTILSRACESGRDDKSQRKGQQGVVSEGLLWRCFDLIVLGLQDVSGPEFSEALATAEVPTTAMVLPAVIERLRQSKEWPGEKGAPRFGPVATWIIDRLKGCPSETVREGLAAAGIPLEAAAGAAAEAAAAGEESEARKKWRAAVKKQKAKIMANFKSKQSAFADKHVADMGAAGAAASPGGEDDEDMTCQTCLDGMNPDEIEESGVVLFGYTQVSQVHEDAVYHGAVTTVCGHGMHVACFDDWKASKIAEILNRPYITVERVANAEKFIDFPCPLCQRVCNVAIPVLPASQATVKGVSGSSSGVGEAGPAEAAAEAPLEQATLVDDVKRVVGSLLGCKQELDIDLLLPDDIVDRYENHAHEPRPQGPDVEKALGEYFSTDDDFGVVLRDFVTTITDPVAGRAVLGLPVHYERVARHFRSTALGMGMATKGVYGAERGLQAMARILVALVRTHTLLCGAEVTAMLRQRLGANIVGGEAVLVDGGDDELVGAIDPTLLFAAGAGLVGSSGSDSDVKALGRLCTVLALFQGALKARPVDANPSPGGGVLVADCGLHGMLSHLLGFAVGEELADDVVDSVESTIMAVALMQAAMLHTPRRLTLPLDVDDIVAAFELPPFETYCAAPDGDVGVESLIAHWFGPLLNEVDEGAAKDDAAAAGRPALAPSPTMRALAPLPREYWELIRRVQTATCPTSGEAMTEPALCLICGDVVCCHCTDCAQRIDVHGLGQVRGACNAHAARCNGGSGMFLQVKKCVVNLIDGDRGAQLPAPYADSHGETDVGLKRGRPLRLKDAAYARLVKIFQTNDITAAITRSLLTDGLTNPVYFRAM